MRVGVTGSRDYAECWKIYRVLEEILFRLRQADEALTLIHGACPTGADAWADVWGEGYDIKIERYPANWEGPCAESCRAGHRRRFRSGDGDFCPAAGNYRNDYMVLRDLDLLLAFPAIGARNSGTKHCMEAGWLAGVKVEVTSGPRALTPLERRRYKDVIEWWPTAA